MGRVYLCLASFMVYSVRNRAAIESTTIKRMFCACIKRGRRLTITSYYIRVSDLGVRLKLELGLGLGLGICG